MIDALVTLVGRSVCVESEHGRFYGKLNCFHFENGIACAALVKGRQHYANNCIADFKTAFVFGVTSIKEMRTDD